MENKLKIIKFSLLPCGLRRMEEGRNAFKILIVTPTGKRPVGRPRHKWEDNIRKDLKYLSIQIGLIRLRIGINAEPL